MVTAIVLVVSTLPYLFDRWLQGASPLYGWYSWFAFNVTDNCVYLAWMRQYADGAWFQRNLFTSEPQSGHMLNLFFLALGKIGGWTGLPLTLLYHVARLAAGAAFLTMVWRLAGMVFDARDRAVRPEGADTARRIAFLTVAFGSGLGWVPGLWERGFAGPVDTWQPEAVSFLSIYLFPLFTVSLALMLGILVNLLEAERTSSRWPAVRAGLCGFVLGNIHTYDVVTLTVIWLCYLAARAVRDRGLPRKAIGDALIAGAPTALSTGYMLWVFRTETVFAQRVAVPTLSPDLRWVLLGFGLMTPLALVGAWGLVRRRTEPLTGTVGSGLAFLVIWAVANVAVAYLPVSFQRKMLMGAHVPIALLAGAGLWRLTQGLARPVRPAILVAAVAALSLTNVRFMLRDRGSLRHGGETVRAFMLPGERAALDWVRRNVERDVIIQPLPWIAAGEDGRLVFADTTLACFAPGLTGNAVHAGHWGETPSFGATMGEWVRFLSPGVEDAQRLEMLRRTGVRYLLFGQKRPETRDERASAFLARSPVAVVPSYLRRVDEACNEDVDVFEVEAP
ncbi:MAG: hypothetical protein GX446_06830 [Chthonomonadales bacterium]|nr:hypothetical protein [Chthonomonadales bacterium]